MEMDLLDGNGMGASFCFSQVLEDGQRVFSAPVRKGARLDDLLDVRQVAMLFIIESIDIELRSGHSVTFCLFQPEGCLKIQAFQRVFKTLPIRASIDESADSHIAA